MSRDFLIIVELIFTILNMATAFYSYDKKKYKTAMIFMFAAGICFMGFINAIRWN